ncbi:helix-turn-helix domain-containing protein, partial [Flavobacteriaceae bacterium]|nr:helix-turn-helix domain-containing protein [Flavobacteriaceae bacterium]
CYLPFPDKDNKTLGAELKRRRLALEWTQEDTAKYFGILKDSYQNWEWNDYVPHIRNRKKVVEFLGFNYWDDGSNSLSNMVLLYRIEHKLTMSELALKINASTRTIERIENIEENISNTMSHYVLEFLHQN